uniref:Uncharacterized protein n=1 Tax=Helianthus annuus TaxID=4232 RepID=A0A251VR47_HELAN
MTVLSLDRIYDCGHIIIGYCHPIMTCITNYARPPKSNKTAVMCTIPHLLSVIKDLQRLNHRKI